MVLVRLPDSGNLTNANLKRIHVGGDTRRQCRGTKEPKGAKSKANRHRNGHAPEGYQAARKVDNAAIGAVANLRSETELLLYVEKQCEQAEEVVVVYEAGPLGYGLYRKLAERGVKCLVCAPDSTQQQKKRRKNNQIDARTLTSHLFN